MGVRGWGFNPGTWLRGALADVYGLDLTKVHWVEAEPNSLMSVDYPRDPRFSVSKGGDQVAELESGELDAVLTARARRWTATARGCSTRSMPRSTTGTAAASRSTSLVAKRVADANPARAGGRGCCDEARRLYYANAGRRAHGAVGWLREHGLPARERAGEQPLAIERSCATRPTSASSAAATRRKLFFDGALKRALGSAPARARAASHSGVPTREQSRLSSRIASR